MKVYEVVVGKFGDVIRVASGIESVSVIGAELCAHVAVDDAIEIRVSAFHFVEDDPFDDEVGIRAARLGEIEVMPLLLKVFLRDQRLENSIAVNAGQVEVVTLDHAGARVDRLVRIGHRIQKRGQAGLEQFDERVFDGVLLRAAQDGVFKDVGQPGVVRRRGAEGKCDEILGIFIVKMKCPCAALVVLHAKGRRTDVRELGDVFDSETV